MRILYIGDIMGEMGIRAVAQVLPSLISERQIDLVIAQGENVTAGKGMLPEDMDMLMGYGVHFFTGGNWSLFRPELFPALENAQMPVIRPANYPAGTPGLGWKIVPVHDQRVLVVSLLGKIVGKDADTPLDNPLHVIDHILSKHAATELAAIVVNIHGDYSSEKVVLGQYLDGKVSAVLGDHWHVPTADAMVLPGGTAHMTDVGMCGALYGSLGVETGVIIDRWRNGRINRNQMVEHGPLQFNAALIEIDHLTGHASSIEHVRKIVA